jgi:hypothetical protein
MKRNTVGRRIATVVGLLACFAVALPATGLAGTPSAPTVSTSVTSNVTSSSAILYGYVNANGQDTNYAFQYGTTTTYGKQTTLTSAGNGTTSVKEDQAISGLAAKTVYHYRIIATSPGGTVQGEDQTFTTSAAPAPPSLPVPTVSTSGVSGVTYSSATLYGYVDPKGQATTFAFQYGTTGAYGLQTPLSAAGSGTANIKVTQGLTGLKPATLYHYRIIASSSAGKVLGSDRTFTTAKIPLSLQIVGSPNPVVFGAPFLVEGALSGTGGANHEVVLQSNQFPFTTGFKQVGNPEVTNSLGGFSFPVLGLTNTAQLRVVTVGKPSISSPILTEGVAVRVSFHAHKTNRRGVYRLYGTVAPAEVGALVGFQLLKPGHKSVNEGGTVVKAGTTTVSRFSRRVRIRHKGLYRALIKISDGAHVSNYSEPVLIR